MSTSLASDLKADLCQQLSASADLAVNFLESKMQEDGSYGDELTDIACYFKSPLMFLSAGRPDAAKRCLSYIVKHFFYPDSDFKTLGNIKSINPAYNEYWSYVNGWIIRAFNQLGMRELSSWATKYFNQFNVGQGIFLTQNLDITPRMTDVLTVAHHGLVNLENNEFETAFLAGSFLCEAFKKQPDLCAGFYLRFDLSGQPLKHCNYDQKPYYFVNAIEPNQLHFMIGYPAAFLAILYKNTNNLDFLNAAKGYLDFSLSCHESVYTSKFSHKLAW
ncbi:MAG TPA: hypothetical protein VHA13_01560, partial [Gammaproteobacteria bacterium]|nr:hypothetical protein [Gammaproteobacteria bacterium]